MWSRKSLLGTGVVLLLGSCSPQVDWENYAPGVQERIDAKATAIDCQGLQEEFDAAAAMDDAQRANFGSGNADLMGYIDGKLSDAGCYR